MHSIASCAAWNDGIGISRGIGRDERQVARVSEIDQRVFGGLLDRVVRGATISM